jgi:hypothetical protein
MFHCSFVGNKKKTKNYHTVGIVSKSNRNHRKQRAFFYIAAHIPGLAQVLIHSSAHSWLGTGTYT